MTKIKIGLVKGGRLPEKGSAEAACYDCYAREIIDDGSFVRVKLGFWLDLDKNIEVQVRPRSNTSSHPLVMHPGTGDPDYKGFEYEARFQKIPVIKKTFLGTLHSIAYAPFPYQVGDRVCQISFKKIEETEFEITEAPGATTRTGGFGSTGLREIVDGSSFVSITNTTAVTTPQEKKPRKPRTKKE